MAPLAFNLPKDTFTEDLTKCWEILTAAVWRTCKIHFEHATLDNWKNKRVLKQKQKAQMKKRMVDLAQNSRDNEEFPISLIVASENTKEWKDDNFAEKVTLERKKDIVIGQKAT